MICNFKTANYDNIKIREIAYSIKKVSNHLAFKSTCLIQALTAKLMLSNVPDLLLTIGVSLENGFEAHAWIEKDGRYIIGETPVKQFTPIWNLE